MPFTAVDDLGELALLEARLGGRDRVFHGLGPVGNVLHELALHGVIGVFGELEPGGRRFPLAGAARCERQGDGEDEKG
jgi:hypothetical protein